MTEVGDDGPDIKSIIAAADTNKDGTIDYEVSHRGVQPGIGKVFVFLIRLQKLSWNA